MVRVVGQPAPFNTNGTPSPPSFSPGSRSASSSRTVSTASDSSTASSQLGPPMTRDDVRIIFGNIGDLAMFSDHFVDRLEEALGGALDGGSSEDRVGALFLEIVSFHLFYRAASHTSLALRPDPGPRTSLQDVHHSSPDCTRPSQCSAFLSSAVGISVTYPNARIFLDSCLGSPLPPHKARTTASQVFPSPRCYHRRHSRLPR